MRGRRHGFFGADGLPEDNERLLLWRLSESFQKAWQLGRYGFVLEENPFDAAHIRLERSVHQRGA